MSNRIIVGAVLCGIAEVASAGCSFSGTGAGANVDAEVIGADGVASTAVSGTTPHHDAGAGTTTRDAAATD